jgi:glucokinase
MRAALVDRESRIAHPERTSTDAKAGRDAVLPRFLDLLKRVESKAGDDGICGVGVCMPGPIDPVSGVLYNPPNLPGWDGFSLKSWLQEQFDYPVAVGNDANLAALAEHRYGAGRGHDNVVYLTLSTGVGGGLILDGKMYVGGKGYAAEIGHMTIDQHGPVAPNGVVGSLEYLASGTAVGRIARERLAQGEESALRDLCGGDVEKVDAAMVSEAARAGDALAKSVMDGVAHSLGTGIVNVLHIFDPDVIVLGGGLSNSLDLLTPGIERQIDTHAMANFRGRRPIVKSALGDDAGLLGAAALVFADVDGG